MSQVLLYRAIDVALDAHATQTDKAGKPYIGHVSRVAQAVAAAGGSDTAVTVAWLHDVVEDSGVTIRDLALLGFPASVCVAVDAITRRPHEASAVYYDRVRAVPTALLVKEADLADNSDPGRLALLPEDTRLRLSRKYARARAALGLVPAGQG